MQMSAGKRLRIFFSGRGQGGTSSSAPDDASGSGSAHVPSPAPVPSPSPARPQREGRTQDRRVTASARRNETHLLDEDEDMDVPEAA